MLTRILGLVVLVLCVVAGWIWVGPWIGGLFGLGGLLWNIIGAVIGLAVSGPICAILFKRR